MPDLRDASGVSAGRAHARTGEVVVSGYAGLEPEEADIPLAPDRAHHVRLGVAIAGIVALIAAIDWAMMA